MHRGDREIRSKYDHTGGQVNYTGNVHSTSRQRTLLAPSIVRLHEQKHVATGAETVETVSRGRNHSHPRCASTQLLAVAQQHRRETRENTRQRGSNGEAERASVSRPAEGGESRGVCHGGQTRAA